MGRSTNLKYVRAQLENVNETRNPRGLSYEVGTFATEQGHWSVGIVQLLEPGNESAALAAFEAIQHFRPQVVMFVGIAGGVKDVELGDVIVGTKIYGYASGSAGRQFLPRPDVGESSEILLQQALSASRRQEWLGRIKRSADTGKQPRVFVAPIAAGPAVLKSRTSVVYKFLKTAYGDALAVEMEGRGFLKAARTDDTVRALVVRGISDLINKKAATDRAGWQAIASDRAAAFAFEVLARQSASDQEVSKRVRPSVPTSSIEQLLKHLVGNDPVSGNLALEELVVMGAAALPYLKGLLNKCGVNEYLMLQASVRLPKAFRLIGGASTETLIDVIKTGKWAAKLEAARCFYGSPRFPAANDLAGLLKSWSDPDVARCAIEALGWLGCWEWSHRIEEAAFDGDDYAFEKLSRYTFRASSLMLALETDRSNVGQSLLRVERVVTRWQEKEKVSDDDLLSEWKSLSKYFRSTATEAIHSWAHAESKLLRKFAIEIFRSRRPPASLGYLTGLANDEALSPETLWRAHDALGEIGTREACCAVVELMDSEEQDSRVTETWLARVAALSKMYQHLDDQQYEKYGNKILLSRFIRMNAWYTGLRRVPRVSGMDKFLNSNEEWVRRPAALCLGIMEGPEATPKLKQYLRHAPSNLDSLFILAGLLRSGASQYYSKYYEILGEAINFQTISSLEYLWKREFVALLAIDPKSGKGNANAWAEILFVDADECIEEVEQILPYRGNGPQADSAVKDSGIAKNKVPDFPRVSSNSKDFQKGRWLSRASRDGRRLTADVRKLGRKSYLVGLHVSSTDGTALVGPVTFHLHDSYPRMTQKINKIIANKASFTEITATGPYTVGATVRRADGMLIPLELDLSRLKVFT
jgi:nucleoside phosphorylase